MIITAKRFIKCTKKCRKVADKGHFVVYTTDNRRFMVPLECLNSCVFRELLNLSEEVFGISSDGPITLPCDPVFMKYVMSLIQNEASRDLEMDLLSSMTSGFSPDCLQLVQSDGFSGLE